MERSLSEADKLFWEKSEENGKKLLRAILTNLDRTNKVSMLYTMALKHFYARVALGESEALIQEALALASQAIETCFYFATGRASSAQIVDGHGEVVEVTLNDKFNPANYTEDIDYVNGMYLAMLYGKGAGKKLTAVAVEELTFSNNKTDAFWGLYANFLRSVLLGDGQAGDWIIKAFKATFPDQIQFAIPEYLEANQVEHLKVWIALLGKDEDKFNSALEEALAKHHAYWSQDKVMVKGGLQPKEDEEGFVSLPLTAICKFAHQHGISIRTKSNYIPEFLVYGS